MVVGVFVALYTLKCDMAGVANSWLMGSILPSFFSSSMAAFSIAMLIFSWFMAMACWGSGYSGLLAHCPRVRVGAAAQCGEKRGYVRAFWSMSGLVCPVCSP